MHFGNAQLPMQSLQELVAWARAPLGDSMAAAQDAAATIDFMGTTF